MPFEKKTSYHQNTPSRIITHIQQDVSLLENFSLFLDEKHGDANSRKKIQAKIQRILSLFTNSILRLAIQYIIIHYRTIQFFFYTCMVVIIIIMAQ